MKLLVRNGFFRGLSLSRFFNRTGSSIYNLVFVIYASSLPNAKFAIGIANLILLAPLAFTIFAGIKADEEKEKGKRAIQVGFFQSLLFLIVALFAKETSYFAFSIMCLLNIISDVASDYASGLFMPMMQYNIAGEDLMEAYSFTQFLGYICNLLGQGLGVWLLSISEQNFTFVALLNALSFLLSSLILFVIRKDLKHALIERKKEQESLSFWSRLKELYQNMELIFKESESSHFVLMLVGILLINALGGALGSIYTLFLLDSPFFGLSYAQSLLLVEVVQVGGIVLGSLTPHDYFSKQSLASMMKWTSISFVLLAFLNALQVFPLIAVGILGFMSYLVGKVNPKMDTLLMTNLPADVLAQTSNLLSLLFTLSIPLGVILFSSLAVWDMGLTWLFFLAISFLSLILSFSQKRKVSSSSD